jgi:hypothetical protein
MLKRQLGLLVISTILLSTTLVHAAEIPGGTDLSVGNIRIQTSDRGEVNIKTPNIDINSAKVIVGRVSIDRNRRRNRKAPSMRRGREIPSAAILRQRAMDKVNSVESSDRVGNSTTRTSTNDSHTVTEQNIQCSGSGSSVIQSSQTINGRTVSSETRTNCN